MSLRIPVNFRLCHEEHAIRTDPKIRYIMVVYENTSYFYAFVPWMEILADRTFKHNSAHR